MAESLGPNSGNLRQGTAGGFRCSEDGCFVSDKGANTIRLSYSYAQDDQIEPGIKTLAEIIKGDLLETGRG